MGTLANSVELDECLNMQFQLSLSILTTKLFVMPAFVEACIWLKL